MEMKNIYSKQGLPRVINASGRMTKLGVSAISDEVGQAMVEAAQNYVVVDDLLAWAGKKVGSLLGCEDACLTSSAAAGIALSVASLICGKSGKKAEQFQRTLQKEPKREVIVLKGHNVQFGAPVATMVELGGGIVVEAGYANKSDLDDIEEAISNQTAAILYVKSHHCVQKNMVGVEEVVAFAKQRNIPVIVDAAAEEDLTKYIAMGPDFVCFSGAKAICGPTSGFVACRTTQLATNMRLQYRGIGRAMKIGKENIMGLVTAIERYVVERPSSVISKEELEAFTADINTIEGLRAGIIQDEAGRAIYRVRVAFDEVKYGLSAKQVVSLLAKRDPAIYTRDHQANEGMLSFDPRPLASKEELQEIAKALREVKENKK